MIGSTGNQCVGNSRSPAWRSFWKPVRSVPTIMARRTSRLSNGGSVVFR